MEAVRVVVNGPYQVLLFTTKITHLGDSQATRAG